MIYIPQSQLGSDDAWSAVTSLFEMGSSIATGVTKTKIAETEADTLLALQKLQSAKPSTGDSSSIDAQKIMIYGGLGIGAIVLLVVVTSIARKV